MGFSESVIKKKIVKKIVFTITLNEEVLKGCEKLYLLMTGNGKTNVKQLK